MRSGTLIDAADQRLLADPAWYATGLWEPARGLLFRPPLRPGSALIIPTRGVHTVGMAYSLDLIALDRHWNVLAVWENCAPWRLGPQHRRARYFVEMRAGSLAERPVQPGMRLKWREEPDLNPAWVLPESAKG